MNASLPLVAVVDHDASVRESLPDLLHGFGFSVHAFAGAAELLGSDRLGDIRCMLVNVEMQGMSGLELLHKVKHRGYDIPIVFMSSRGSEALRRRLLEEGASDCLFKPLAFVALVDAIEVALSGRGLHDLDGASA